MAKKSGDKTAKVFSFPAKSEKHQLAVRQMNDELQMGRSFEILSASIKDDFCNYEIIITSGVGKGFKHKVEGKNVGIIEDDLKNAFVKLNIHLAIVDDVFKHADIDIPSLLQVQNHDLTLLYNVTGFVISGGEENESVQLIGNKALEVMAGDRMDLKGPRIPIDNLSGYKWYNELKEAVDDVRREVMLYNYGKYTPTASDEEVDEKQTTLVFDHGEAPMIDEDVFNAGKND